MAKGKSLKKARREKRKLEKIAMILSLFTTTTLRKKRDDQFHYCPSCGEAYCHDFVGQDVFCYDCFYHNCLKEQGKASVCQACGNVRQFT